MRTGPDKVFKPGPNRIFVFGSNLAGVHGAAAALQAHRYYSARWGIGEGLFPCDRQHQAGSYALPTRSQHFVTLPLSRIKEAVDQFLEVAWGRQDLSFFVTKVGCGLAGYSEEEIAPLFTEAPVNCELPYGWRREEEQVPAQALNTTTEVPTK